MKLKINLNNYCRLCAAGDGQLLHCDEVLFQEESSKTTIKDLVQMNIPELLKENEAVLLPKRICVQCVKIMLNWGDFVQRSLNSNYYFLKLLSRDFELPIDNLELVTFIRETKKEFTHNVVKYSSRLTSSISVLLEPKVIVLEKKEKTDIKNLNNENNPVHSSTSPVKGNSIYSSAIPVKRYRPRSRQFGKRKKRSKGTQEEVCECVMCSTELPKIQNVNDGAQLHQQSVCSNQIMSNHQKSPLKTSLDTVQSLNSSTPEKLICSPTVMAYQEIVGPSNDVNEDDCRLLDVDNLVDGSTEWVYRLKQNELIYVLDSYSLNTEGSFSILQRRLVDHLKQIDADRIQMPASDAQQINNHCNDDNCENDFESDVEATEVLPDPDSNPVEREHPYAMKPPPGYFKMEEVLFRPRNSGAINMQFFIGMSSDWTEELIRKMNSSEIMCILEICNIEREGSGIQIKNKLIKYLNYIKAQSITTAEDSKTDDKMNTESALAVSESFTFPVSPGDQSDESPFKGFQSIRGDQSENPSDQSDESPFQGFQSPHTSGNPSDQSDESPFKGFQFTHIRSIAPTIPDQSTNCQKNLNYFYDSDHILNNIKTEIDIPDTCYTEFQDTELTIIKEEPPCSPPQVNPMWTSCDAYTPRYPYSSTYSSTTRKYRPTVNHDVDSELKKYFKLYNIKEDVNKYKCCVVVEKLHPATVSLYCSPCSPPCSPPISYSPPPSSSSSTWTCPSPRLSPCSPPYWHPESPPKVQNDNFEKIAVRKLEDLC